MSMFRVRPRVEAARPAWQSCLFARALAAGVFLQSVGHDRPITIVQPLALVPSARS